MGRIIVGKRQSRSMRKSAMGVRARTVNSRGPSADRLVILDVGHRRFATIGSMHPMVNNPNKQQYSSTPMGFRV